MWGPYQANWRHVRDATSQRFFRARIRHRAEDGPRIVLHGHGRRDRGSMRRTPRILRIAFALAVAAGVVAFSLRLTANGGYDHVKVLAPFALVGLYVTWHSEIRGVWKLAFTVLLLLFLVPLVF